MNMERAVNLAIILYSDSTSLSGSGNVSGWPLVMSFANIPLEQRSMEGGYMLLGLLPRLDSGFESDEKTDLFNYSLNSVIQPLKRLSMEGLEYKGFRMFPSLYAYVHDYPEGCKV